MFQPKNPHNELKLLPPDFDFNDTELLKLVAQARTELGELRGYSRSLPNPLLLLSPAILKESLASSEIEGIHTTILQVLENQLFPDEERRNPDKEVLRYREAIMEAFGKLPKYELSTRLILGMQNKLLPGHPKSYRKVQNAIEDNKTKQILYTPPVQAKIPEFMSNLENFLNNPPKGMDPLIACAVGHYQFEAIHPFEDGNGRTGRILMVLHLINSNLLSLPILYISGYVNSNKLEYYSRLLKVTTNSDWKNYLKFMLTGFKEQAIETKTLISKIMSLYWSTKKELKAKEKKIYSADLVDALFTFPIISPVTLANELDIHYTTASRYLKRLQVIGLLTDRKIGKYHLFMNFKLMDIIHGN